MEENKKEFSFVKEKIKKQPFYQNKKVKMVVFCALLAVVFGIVGSFTFVKSYPFMEKHFGEKEVEEISLPRNEEIEKEETEEETEPSQQIIVQKPQELKLDDYEKKYDLLQELIQKNAKSRVSITAASKDVDWFNELYERREESSGILVGNNGVELLVLTTYSDVENADQLLATFVDGYEVPTTLKKYDKLTDLAIVSINLGSIPEETLESISYATFGSSKTLKVGEPLIAVGGPAGVMDSILYGNMIAPVERIESVDREYGMILTDMVDSNSKGFLMNWDGYIVGIIQDEYNVENIGNKITAYGISDMKGLIESLSNNQDIVYFGITGVEVNEEVLPEESTLHQGIYITNIEMESPALLGGLRIGDIVTKISGQEVFNVKDMQEILLKFSEEQIIEVTVMREGYEGYEEILCEVTLKMLK